jgi:nucleotide-binding universal stress UspA family protein
VTVALAHALGAAVEVVCVGRTLGDDVKSTRGPSPANPDQETVAQVTATLKKARLEVQSRMIDNLRGFAPQVAREVIATGADMVVIGAQRRQRRRGRRPAGVDRSKSTPAGLGP